VRYKKEGRCPPEETERAQRLAPRLALGGGLTALRERLRLVVAGDVGAAIEDLGVAFGDGVVKCHELGFEIALDPALALAVPSTGHASFVLVGDAGGALRFTCLTPADLAAADRWLRGRLRALHPDAGFPDEPRAAPPAGRAAPAAVRFVRLGAGQVPEGPLNDAPPGVPHAFVTQTRFEEEGRAWIPVPVGRWTPGGDGLTAARGGAANFLAIRYHAGRVGVVASPPAGAGVKLWVLRDEAWLPAAARGPDVSADATGATYVEVDEPRLYLLTGDRGEHVLKLSPDAPGLTLHALTFEDVRGADLGPR